MAAADFDAFAHDVPGESTLRAPIDNISIKMSAGYNVISAIEWQHLGEDDRFDLIKARRVTFLAGGVSVPTRVALVWLAANIDRGGDQ